MKRVLAIDPITKGFGFAVLDGPQLLVNWGLRGTKRWPNPRQRYLREIAKLLEVYSPDRIVVEDCLDARSKRGKRSRRLIERIITLAGEHSVPARRISRAGLHRAFAPDHARTKYKIALAIVRRFPELGVRLPPARKPWMSEKAQMGVFDAVALALAFYARQRTTQDGSSETVTVSALKGGETAPSIMRRK
jgi:ribosomal protein L17